MPSHLIERIYAGARATSCHFCWCAQKLPQNPCGQGQFWPPGRKKNIKITSKTPPAGPVFAKTHVFRSFLRVAHPAPYTNAGGKNNENPRSRGGVQRDSYRHGTTSAQKARVAKKTVFFARASGRPFHVVNYTERMKFLRKSRKKLCATLQKRAGFLQSL